MQRGSRSMAASRRGVSSSYSRNRKNITNDSSHSSNISNGNGTLTTLPRLNINSSSSRSNSSLRSIRNNNDGNNNDIIKVGICSVQGRRPYQEDEYSIRPNIGALNTHLFGIFDGHAGGQCSKMISSILPDILVKDSSFPTDLILALQNSYYAANDDFLKVAERMKLHDGSTGITSVFRGLKLVIANVGDCRAVLIRNGTPKQLTIDHKPTDPEEQKRIANYGGHVVYCMGVARVNGVLAVSRAFGNRTIKQVIRPDPDIFSISLVDGDEYLIQASDGMWDVVHNRDLNDICDKFSNEGPQKIAEELVSLALSRGTTDNTTCLVLSLRNYVRSLLRKASGSGMNHISKSSSSNSLSNSLNVDTSSSSQSNNTMSTVEPVSSPVISGKYLNRNSKKQFLSTSEKSDSGNSLLASNFSKSSNSQSGKGRLENKFNDIESNSNINSNIDRPGSNLGSRLLGEATKLFGKTSITIPAIFSSPIQTQSKRPTTTSTDTRGIGNRYRSSSDGVTMHGHGHGHGGSVTNPIKGVGNPGGMRSSPITIGGLHRPRTRDSDRDASPLGGPM